jgi:hypothetical protein
MDCQGFTGLEQRCTGRDAGNDGRLARSQARSQDGFQTSRIAENREPARMAGIKSRMEQSETKENDFDV